MAGFPWRLVGEGDSRPQDWQPSGRKAEQPLLADSSVRTRALGTYLLLRGCKLGMATVVAAATLLLSAASPMLGSVAHDNMPLLLARRAGLARPSLAGSLALPMQSVKASSNWSCCYRDLSCLGREVSVAHQVKGSGQPRSTAGVGRRCGSPTGRQHYPCPSLFCSF